MEWLVEEATYRDRPVLRFESEKARDLILGTHKLFAPLTCFHEVVQFLKRHGNANVRDAIPEVLRDIVSVAQDELGNDN